jgi:hypothetical protein
MLRGIVTDMKVTVGQLRELFRQGIEEAGRVSAHPEYMKKERVRERLQSMIVDAIAAGDITDQASLDGFISALDMSVKALKMVPFDVYSKMLSVPHKG